MSASDPVDALAAFATYLVEGQVARGETTREEADAMLAGRPPRKRKAKKIKVEKKRTFFEPVPFQTDFF